MSVYATIFWTEAHEEAPRRDSESPSPGEPYTVDVAIDTLTLGAGELPWLRVSASDADLPEGCSAVLSPVQGLELLCALQRWRDGTIDPAGPGGGGE